MNKEILNENPENVSDKYNFKLDNYEGPLDLLLDLIKKSKMDIMDIKLSLITDQYMMYMKSLDEIDMDKASEFITVAATLLEIKSKSAIPIEKENMGDEDPERDLILQIQEYKLLKDASEALKEKENINKFYKEADLDAHKTHFVLPQMQINALINAFVDIMAKVDKKVESEEPKKIEKDRFTVAEKISSIKDAIMFKKRIQFEELFEKDQTKSELINIFLALLELMKKQVIKVNQRNVFGNIEILSAGE